MTVSPNDLINAGYVTFPAWMTDKQKESCVQQCGIDITLDEVFVLDNESRALISEDGRVFKKSTMLTNENKIGNSFVIESGFSYDVMSDFYISVPSHLCAMILVRSSLNRNGLSVASGLYDPGFRGNAGFHMRAHAGNVLIQPHTRVAQIVFFQADSISEYSGMYQDIQSGVHWSDGVIGLST